MDKEPTRRLLYSYGGKRNASSRDHKGKHKAVFSETALSKEMHGNAHLDEGTHRKLIMYTANIRTGDKQITYLTNKRVEYKVT